VTSFELLSWSVALNILLLFAAMLIPVKSLKRLLLKVWGWNLLAGAILVTVCVKNGQL
jgi:hypothetical protein